MTSPQVLIMWSNTVGQETTANALSFAVILIHQHPEVLDKCVCVCVCVCVCARVCACVCVCARACM